jgi:hypothetical protein
LVPEVLKALLESEGAKVLKEMSENVVPSVQSVLLVLKAI